MSTRDNLIKEFTELRNARMKRGTTTRTRKIYFDYLNDTDSLAARKSDEELIKAIERFKRENAQSA